MSSPNTGETRVVDFSPADSACVSYAIGGFVASGSAQDSDSRIVDSVMQKLDRNERTPRFTEDEVKFCQTALRRLADEDISSDDPQVAEIEAIEDRLGQVFGQTGG